MKARPFNLFRWIRHKLLPRVRSKQLVSVRNGSVWVPAKLIAILQPGNVCRVQIEGTGEIQERDIKDVVRIHSHTDQTKAYESAYASMLSLLKDIQGIQRQKERMQEELARMERLLENCKLKEETVDRESDEEEVDKHKEITESAGEVFRQLRSRLRTEKSKTSRLSIELNRATIELDALRSQTDKLKEEHRKRLKRIQRESAAQSKQAREEFEAHIQSWDFNPIDVRRPIERAIEQLSQMDCAVPQPVAEVLMSLFEELTENYL